MKSRRPKPRLLICGFGAFAGAPRNPSGAAIEALAASGWAPPDVQPDYLILPVAWKFSAERVETHLKAAPANAVLLVGVATEATAFRIETLARNRACRDRPDGRGDFWPFEPICPDGDETLAATAPCEAMLHAVAAAGLPVELSADAGDYLCNFTLFRLLRSADAWTVGFLHTPQVREFVPGASLGLDDVTAAVRAVATAIGSSLLAAPMKLDGAGHADDRQS